MNAKNTGTKNERKNQRSKTQNRLREQPINQKRLFSKQKTLIERKEKTLAGKDEERPEAKRANRQASSTKRKQIHQKRTSKYIMTNSNSLSHGSSQTVIEPEVSMLPEKSPEISVESVTVSVESTDRTIANREKGKRKEEDEEDEQRERKTKKKFEKGIGKPGDLVETRVGVEKTTLVAQKPVVHDHRRGVTADIIECELSENQLERIRRVYHIPESIELVLPPKGWRASKPPQGYRCTYEDHLRGGLRFPVPEFVKTILNYYEMPLAQIAPNGIRMIIRFLITCRSQGIKSTLVLFRSLFQMRASASTDGYATFSSRGGGMKILTPSNNRGYKPRFFYFREEGLTIPEYWQFNPRPDKISAFRDKFPKNREKLCILETQDGRHFTEEELVDSGLSPAILKKDEKVDDEVGEDQPESSKRRKRKRGKSTQVGFADLLKATVDPPQEKIPNPPPLEQIEGQEDMEMDNQDSGKGQRKGKKRMKTTAKKKTAEGPYKAVIPETRITISAMEEDATLFDIQSTEEHLRPNLDRDLSEIMMDARQAVPLVAKVIEEMATQTTALAGRAHTAEKELKKAQNRLSTAEQEEKKTKEQLDLKDQKIAELSAALEEAKRKELNPGEFGEILVKKVVASTDFFKYAGALCGASMMVGRQEALEEVQKAFPEVKLKKKQFRWDPYASKKADNEYIRLARDEVPEFEVIKKLKQHQGALSSQEFKEWMIDHNPELDKSRVVIPTDQIYEDDLPTPSTGAGAQKEKTPVTEDNGQV